MSLPRLAMLSLLCAVASCASFSSALTEFDRVAGIDGSGVEPAVLSYPENVRRWAAAITVESGEEIPPAAVQSPSAYARDRIIALVRRARGDLLDTGQVTERLSLVIERDRNALNRIEAIEGLGDLLHSLEIDPIDRMTVEPAQTRRTRTATVLELLNDPRVFEFDREDAAARTRYFEVMRAIASGPLTTAADDRRSLRRLQEEASSRADRELRRLAVAALYETVANVGVRLLQVSTRSEDPRLREAATLVIFRNSGPKALPQLLWLLSRPNGDRFRYPVSLREHRTLLRLCSQVSGDRIFKRFRGGPRVVDYVYDLVVEPGAEFEGVRMIALETLARCLGRPIAFDREWADQWWRQLSLEESN